MNKKHIALRELGFTLIELLVVMAITIILLGLIFGPLYQGFNLTNRARVQVLTQDTARHVMEVLQRDTANGVFIFDNFSQPIYGWFRNANGVSMRIPIPFGMIDMVPPAKTNDQNPLVPLTGIDPSTGLAIDRGDINLPLAPGRVMVRWWTALRATATTSHPTENGQPILPYGNFYEDPRDAVVNRLNLHNPYLLYRAVFSPFLPNLDALGNVQVDKRLFHVDAQGNPILYDPNFAYDNSVAQNVTLPGGTVTNMVDGWRDENNDGKVNISENWHALARAMVPVDRADEVSLDRDDKKKVIYDLVTLLPRPNLHTKFQPTYVGNDAGNPTSTNDAANESPLPGPPSSYVETNGHWTTPFRQYIFRSSATPPGNPFNQNPLTYYVANGDGKIYYQIFDTTTNTGTYADPGQVIFNGFTPFTDNTDPTRPVTYGGLTSAQRPDILFTVDPRRGMANFALSDKIVLHDAAGKIYPSTFNSAEPNRRYCVASALGGNAWRMISLNDLDDATLLAPHPTCDTLGQLPKWNPEISVGGPRPPLEVQPDKRRWIPNAQIVPGSEIVVGPDMLPGPHYGQAIAYTRVPRGLDPTKAIGPNEYMINYTDFGYNANPGNPLPMEQQMGTIIFDSHSNDPAQFQKHDLPTTSYVNGVLTGTAANIVVTYQIQNNLAGDVVKADYLTRQLMTVGLGVRLYDFNSGQPQQVNLTQKVKVRNLQR